MIVEACLWVFIANSPFGEKSGPLHAAEIKQCISTVEKYVQAHCPTANRRAALKGVAFSDAKDDATALTAACKP